MTSRLTRQIFNAGALFFIITGCISCEGQSCARGDVKDQTSNLAIDSVYVHVINGTQTMYTDSSGKFGVCGEFGSCMSGCKDIVIEFSKSGYKTQTLQNPEPGIIVLLERQ